MARPVIVANCSGFYGDRMAAAREMVNGGPIDVLTGDWLAELTMLILAKSQRKDPNLGYAHTFVKQMQDVLVTCQERGIKIVANAGGLNPRGCAEAVAEVAAALGISPRIAYVTGDNLLPQFDDLTAAGQLTKMPGSPDLDPERIVSVNAYLGCWGVVEALTAGADVVITGRTTDAALVCAPAAWWHGWKRDDWDRLAGAVVAGHVIECGTHATGGNYSFFTEIADLRHAGFPWAAIAEDGSAVIGKHDNTGGAVNLGTVTSQLLYEIGSPRYLGPDVDSLFDTLNIEQVDVDRVLIRGTKGEPPSGSLKVSMNMIGGYRNDLKVAVCGLDVEAKAELLEAAFWESCPYQREDYAEVSTRLVRSDKVDAETNEEATAVWELTLKDHDRNKVGRAASNAAVELALATIPGFFMLSGPPGAAREFGVHGTALVPSAMVTQRVSFLDGQEVAVPPGGANTAGAVTGEAQQLAAGHANGHANGRDWGPTSRAPLGTIIGARSGDKGGDGNIGVYARTDEAWEWLNSYLTTDRLRELLPEVQILDIDRYQFPRIRSLNFLIRGILGQGVAASTRQDGQGKSLGEWLRSRLVTVPVSLLPAAATAQYGLAEEAAAVDVTG